MFLIPAWTMLKIQSPKNWIKCENSISLHLSRDARKPMWEEEYNCRGGTFRLRVNKKDTVISSFYPLELEAAKTKPKSIRFECTLFSP